MAPMRLTKTLALLLLCAAPMASAVAATPPLAGAKVTTVKVPSSLPPPAAAKSAEDRREGALKRENCERARESGRAIQSGQRLSRFNDKGECVFLDEGQMQQELAKSQENVQQGVTSGSAAALPCAAVRRSDLHPAT